jgi:UDP-N-acetylglucosamine--N-acetylmuramyl-(pentapeptide) pyrophosphoryl-undecaprenol N-acetylglucosamine transferase
MTKKIIFTGGGSAGHVTLNTALIPLFAEQGWSIAYVGSYNGIEKELLARFSFVRYHAIATGKLRRYFSWKNLTDMLRIPLGIIQAVGIVLDEKPDIIFSKGGFVSFPLVLAGKVVGCPVVMHESDVTPGLANKMSLPFVSRFFTTFEDTAQYVREKDRQKVLCVGPVLSDRLKNGQRERGCALCGFSADKPVIMAIGGSLGAKSLNAAVRQNLKALLERFQVIHICGKGQVEDDADCEGYKQFEYVDQDLKDLMEAADVVISRAGSNSIFELLSLAKPMIMVPLPTGSSRGEQTLNARSFQRKGYGEVLPDEELADEGKLVALVQQVYDNREKYRQAMKTADVKTTDHKRLAEIVMSLSKK